MTANGEKGGVSNGAMAIVFERLRQVEGEGWTPEHDDENDRAEMLAAAGQYLEAAEFVVRTGRDDGDRYFRGLPPTAYKWPWPEWWWKPTYEDPVRMLVKAGALIAAEIDRIQRAGES